MKISWAKTAEADLDHIQAFIAQDNPIAAIDTVLSVIDNVEHLPDHPYLGRAGRVHGTRELVVSDTPYIVAYTVSEDAVYIIRVLHSAQKWPDTFDNEALGRHLELHKWQVSHIQRGVDAAKKKDFANEDEVSRFFEKHGDS